MGHGTQSMIYLKGRVVRKHRVLRGEDDDSAWRNLRNTYYRFKSHKVADTPVSATIGGVERKAHTDSAGFFDFEIALDTPLPADQVWHEVHISLPAYHGQAGAATTLMIMIPPGDAQFGVISDLDDTVLRSDVVNKLKLAYNTFFYNAHTRLPFAGVAEFYRALQQGTNDHFNPIFYVSNSPWNLYDLIADFLAVRGIPLGPIFLIHLGLSPTHLTRPDPIRYKLAYIERVFDTHPDLSFLLIGDSGEHDPEIYLQVIQKYAERIRAIYIRDVTGASRKREIQAIVERASDLGVEMLLVADTVAAAEHAAQHGLIRAEQLPAIKHERYEDKQPEPLDHVAAD